MTQHSTGPVTRLLQAWSKGDDQALEQLMPLVYDELHDLAEAYLRREPEGHTLQTTALIHEAFIRLLEQQRLTWESRTHFFGIAARMMRRILVDHARRRRYRKRGGGARRLSLDEAPALAADQVPELVALDDALSSLEAIAPRQVRVVELRYFAGLTRAETAEVLGISVPTVARHWRVARAWLLRQLESADEAGDPLDER